MIKGTVLWVIWLECNRLYFTTDIVKNIRSICLHLLILQSSWYKNTKDSLFLNLTVIMPQDVQSRDFQGVNPMMDLKVVQEANSGSEV
jgi:hypothetical protein